MLQFETLPEIKQSQLNKLRRNLKKLKHVCVAYSGGVDSSLIAAIAKEQLGTQALAVTGVSPALAPHLRNEAKEQAAWIGIRHQECLTKELNDQNYKNNPEDRCFACKQELHKHLKEITKAATGYQVVDGVNFDDIKDYRPGIAAAKAAGVRSPLVELKIDKQTVREISKALGFPWWNKPAQPCLASRFPYGQPITEKLLLQVNQAESWLRSHGFKEVRVRNHNLTARIEVPENQIEKLISNLGRKTIVKYFLSIGFNSVCLDLEGLVSGKLNRK